MSRIDDIFAALRRDGRTALMPFLIGGYPSMEAFSSAVLSAEGAGARIIEVGFPFSDPIADGPVIACAMYEAIQAGTTPAKIFDAVGELRGLTSLGLVAMVSESIVHRIGVAKFIDRAASSGFDGLLVPDIDLSAAAEMSVLTAERGLAFAMLVAPTTSEQRMQRIVRLCRGFVYVLARTGLTGERSEAVSAAAPLEQLRRLTDLPLAVGFGISSAEQVKQVTRTADAAIVGSALVRRMGEAEDPAVAAAAFIRELAAGLERVTPTGRA